MSMGNSCICKRKRGDIDGLVCTQYKCNHSAFNGYHYTPSDYSTVYCNASVAAPYGVQKQSLLTSYQRKAKMEQQKDKVIELANKLIEIVDDKNGWESDSQKLGYIKAYLCGLTDGFDYCVEKIESLSSVRLEPVVSGEIPSDACFNAQPAKELFTCTQCGQKTTNPIYIKHPSAKNPYCEKCAKLAWRQAKDAERG